MVGEIDDPLFEEHLQEGPYIVFDDAAKPEYKSDPRVYFVPGHPVLQTALPELMRGLGLSWPGHAVMKWEQLERWGKHNLQYGAPARKLATIAKPIAGAALLFLAAGAAMKLLKRISAET